MSGVHQGRQAAACARRIVVKVGSSTLTRDGQLNERAFAEIARQVSELCERGCKLALVSSGAIAVGSRELGWDEVGPSIPERQAAAAVGQIGLINLYRERFAHHGRRVAQVLVTRAELENRERFLNARHTLNKLFELGVVPIVNENDTVATEEIRFGDNDNLSATVLNLVAAELLVILTDVDGLLSQAPKPGAPPPLPIQVVEAITPEMERAAQGSSSAFGRGGMKTKLEAARAASRCGADTILCNGATRDVLLRVTAGEPLGTIFLSHSRLASRKHWLAFTARTLGEIEIDEGAARALVEQGKSLLAAGIAEVRGEFGIGDAVTCVDAGGRELARGLVAYSADEIRRIARLPARRISQVLGYSNGDEVIHRNDLVLLQETHE